MQLWSFLVVEMHYCSLSLSQGVYRFTCKRTNIFWKTLLWWKSAPPWIPSASRCAATQSELQSNCFIYLQHCCTKSNIFKEAVNNFVTRHEVLQSCFTAQTAWVNLRSIARSRWNEKLEMSILLPAALHRQLSVAASCYFIKPLKLLKRIHRLHTEKNDKNTENKGKYLTSDEL